MKKILSILLAVIMVFSVISCLSVGAVNGSTADEAIDAANNTLKQEEDNGSVFSEEYELGAVVVSLKKDSPSVEALLADFEITESRLIMHGSSGQSTYYVKFAEKTEEVVLEAIAALSKSPYVNYAEPNYRAYIDSVDTSTTIGVDPEVDLQVRKDVYENIYKGIIDVELDDIIITYFGTLSDGSPVLSYSYRGAGSSDVTYTETIGDYYYVFYADDLAYVYRDHNFYNIFRAYDEGLIDDNSLAELCEISKEYLKRPYNYCYFSFYPKTGESGLDHFVESDIKFDAYQNLYGNEYVPGESLDLSSITVTYFGTLSDGSLVVNVDNSDIGRVDMVFTEIIGDYRYIVYDSGQKAYIYKDHQFYYIADAYKNGMIDDVVLDELYACSVEYSKNQKNDKSFVLYPLSEDPTEPTTQPDVTVPKETTATSSDNLNSSTADTAKTTTPATSDIATAKNSNGTVQTGQNNLRFII